MDKFSHQRLNYQEMKWRGLLSMSSPEPRRAGGPEDLIDLKVTSNSPVELKMTMNS